MNAQTAIITRASIDEIVGYRQQAIDLFAQARDLIRQGMEAASLSTGGSGISVSESVASKAFSIRLGDEFVDDMRQLIDSSAWKHLVMGYGFEKLMDRQAMDEFHNQLYKEPPELTIELAEATLMNLLGDSGRLFRRGIANAFAKLDRRFRSHDGFKIGTRVILDRAFDEYGNWNYHAGRQETLRDIEKTFFRLDEKEVPARYAGVVGAIDGKRTSCYPTTFEAESEYIRVKVFKNGNAHLWFTRNDLLRQVNKLLAEHYGEVLGASADAVGDDPFEVFRNPRTDLAKNMGWFPTPAKVVSEVISRGEVVYAKSYQPDGRTTVRILEPSAGEGAIAMGAIEAMKDGGVQPEFTCIELNAERAAALRSAGFIKDNGHKTVEADFLTCTPDQLGLFDYILMNPPFDMQRDIDHVYHATKFLAPGGRLVAIMSAGVEFRENRKAVAFRKIVEDMDGEFFDLPAGSFEESGTMVNTCLVTLSAPRA